MKVKRIIKDDILSSKKLLELAKRVNWNEDKMLDELRKQNPKVSNSDLQAIVEAFMIINKPKQVKDLVEKDNIIETYLDKSDNSKIFIVKVPSGKFYNVYGEYKGASNAGPYKTLDEARKYVKKHRSSAVKDSNERLKSYNIKNHNTGITYKVKATSYRDAKDKYEKYIKDGNSFTYKGYVIIKSSYGWKVKIGNKIIEFATDKEAKEYIDLHKDTFSEDAKWDTLLANLGFAHNQGTGDIQIWKYRDKDRNKFEKAIEHIRRVDRKLILSASSQSSGEHKITIMKPTNDSFVSDTLYILTKNNYEAVSYNKALDYGEKYGLQQVFKVDKRDFNSLVKTAKSANVRNPNEWAFNRLHRERKTKTFDSFDGESKNFVGDVYIPDIEKHLKSKFSKNEKNLDKIFKELKSKFPNADKDEIDYVVSGYLNDWNDNQYNKLLSKYFKDATLAQLEIKNTFLEEDDDANEVKYLGFNDDRKISFYEYGDKYFAFFDLENRVEVIEKDEVQRILKKNLIKETDQDKDELFREGDEGIATTVRSENEGGSK